MTLEEKRLERLRNLLSPFITLSQLIEDELDNEEYKQLILDTAKTCNKLNGFVKKALKDNVTIEELNSLYLENSDEDK